jgi:hypothetical protein
MSSTLVEALRLMGDRAAYQPHFHHAAANCIEALMTDNERLRHACEPFVAMAAELFARNWNRDQIVIALDNPDKPNRLTFSDFLELHAAFNAEK